MKIKLSVVAAGMLLTLGPALAGGQLYAQKEKALDAAAEATINAQEVTPELIAKWKAGAATAGYSPPMLPI